MGTSSVNWLVKNLDSGETLLPPYPVEGAVRMTAGGNIARQPRYGMQDPLVQWTGGKGRDISFTAIFWSADRSDSIRSRVSKYIALSEKNSRLGRLPICHFSLGNIVAEVVLVEAVDIDIEDIRPDGEARMVRLAFSLVRYVPFSQKRIDPTKPVKESYYLVASSYEASYEAIARRFYGNPLLGDRLRKRHPDMPGAPTVGSTIKVPARSIIIREPIEPSFHALSLTDEATVAVFVAKLAARAKLTAVLP